MGIEKPLMTNVVGGGGGGGGGEGGGRHNYNQPQASPNFTTSSKLRGWGGGEGEGITTIISHRLTWHYSFDAGS